MAKLGRDCQVDDGGDELPPPSLVVIIAVKTRNGHFFRSQLGLKREEVDRSDSRARDRFHYSDISHSVRLSEDIISTSERPFPLFPTTPSPSFTLWIDNKTKRGCLLPLVVWLAAMSGQRRNLVLARYRPPVSHSPGPGMSRIDPRKCSLSDGPQLRILPSSVSL